MKTFGVYRLRFSARLLSAAETFLSIANEHVRFFFFFKLLPTPFFFFRQSDRAHDKMLSSYSTVTRVYNYVLYIPALVPRLNLKARATNRRAHGFFFLVISRRIFSIYLNRPSERSDVDRPSPPPVGGSKKLYR